MITGKQKPLDEIVSYISGYKKILILGCGTCVTVCLTGGDREARLLARDLSHPKYFSEKAPEFVVETIERQCEWDMIENYLVLPDDCDAVLSLACGAGVQTLSGIFVDIPVLPALNTTFIGAYDEPGIWREKCHGCGDCILSVTGGICPVARCAKKLFNGPCGGSKNGKCEVSEEIECAWALIVQRLIKLDRINLYERIIPLKDWSMDKGKGPRKLVKSEIEREYIDTTYNSREEEGI